MTRPRLLALFAAALLCAPAARGQYSSFGAPGVGYYSLYRYQTSSFPLYNPAFGNLRLTYYRASPIGAPRVTGIAPSVGTYYGGDPTAIAKQRQDLLRAQRAARGAVQAEQFNKVQAPEAGGFDRDAGAKPRPKPAVEVKPELLNPDPAAVASGEAHNRLADLMAPLSSKAGKNVETPYLPPDLAARLVLAGPPTADTVNFLRAGELVFPPALVAEPSFEPTRQAVSREFHQLLDVAGQQRSVVAPQADKLTAAVKKGREQSAGIAGAAGEAVNRFWGRLEAAATLMKEPATAGAFQPGWNSVGLTGRELADYLAKHKLRLAPGEPEAYAAVYKGMLETYRSLLRGPR